ncbi:galectin-3-binding protein B-like [Amphiura filiformis]|uniref:galectin-3-binding protein B-like n=1 Tax=Amphiura filiformis TaxID=82378 RepID=UPI003B2118B6
MIMDSSKAIIIFAILIFYRSAELAVKALDITDIRLRGSPVNTPNAGRVQVYDTDQWKDVCHDGDNGSDKDWSIKEAMVTCRQLGYPGTAMIRKGGYGNGNSENVLDAFDCDGDESNLSECTSSNGPDDETKCSNGNDAGVICAVPGYLGCYVDGDG